MKQKHLYFLTHLVGWLLFLSLPFLFLTRDWRAMNILSLIFSQEFLVYFIFYFSFFYLNIFWLLPKLYASGKKYIYLSIVILLLFLTLIVHPFENLIFRKNTIAGNGDLPAQMAPPNQPDLRGPPARFREDTLRRLKERPPLPARRGPQSMHFDIISAFLFLLTLALGIMMESARKLRKTQEKLLKAEAEKAQAELSFLKAQIHPHFLFNTLNNIYSLAVMKSDETPEAIMRLSGIMRYVTDDADSDAVPLRDEIACIENYIYLNKLKSGDRLQVYFVISGVEDHDKIAPLILLTFVENAFKHGVSKREVSPVNMTLTVHNSELIFTVKNKIFPARSENERSGIGIENTRKRLDLIYGDQYTLLLEDKASYYQVVLTLHLNG